MTKRSAVKFILVIFFIAIPASLLIELFYNLNNRKENIDSLSIQEKDIVSKCGKDSGKYIFCSYPELNFDSQITWDTHDTHFGSRPLALSFKGNDIKRYLGIHFSLTLNLRPYLEKGKLDFWVKGRKNYPFIKKLGIYLKEGQSMKRTAGITFPVEINENWKNVSLPLSQFFVIKDSDYDLRHKSKKFSWEIQEALFSVEPFSYNTQIEIYVGGLKILNENEILYDLS